MAFLLVNMSGFKRMGAWPSNKNNNKSQTPFCYLNPFPSFAFSNLIEKICQGNELPHKKCYPKDD